MASKAVICNGCNKIIMASTGDELVGLFYYIEN